jgi:hypothetical protein
VGRIWATATEISIEYPAEIIALAQSKDLESLYGAVTIEDDWRFGFLDVAKKQVIHDFKLFMVPDDLGDLIRILLGVLEQ